MEIPKITEVARKYNEISEIWNKKDSWHIYTKSEIELFISKYKKQLIDGIILNAGSAGYSYELDESNICHLDIAEQKISHLKNSKVGSIEAIPFDSNSFDSILCVGSVINYCDPIPAISEFSRVIKQNGVLILEFENSKTLELLFSKKYNKKATLQKTFYNGKEEILWYYSENFIRNLVKEFNFTIVDLKRFHHFTPIVYRILKKENFAARFTKLDKLIQPIPILNRNSSNVIFLLNKN